MKKITLIACAALVAGLFISCSNDAGAKDYNSVRYTTNVNNYLVSGTKTTVVTSESADYDYDANGKNETQISGSKRTTTTTKTIKSAASTVSYSTDSAKATNYQDYTIRIDGSKGFNAVKYTDWKTWNGTAWVDDSTKPADVDKGTGDPEEHVGEAGYDTISAFGLTIYSVDGTLYYSTSGNGQNFVVEADEDAFAAGEDFTLKVTYTTTDTSSDSTDYTSEDKADSRSKSTSKTTVTYDLSFTAK